jgi:hypothetical protein
LKLCRASLPLEGFHRGAKLILLNLSSTQWMLWLISMAMDRANDFQLYASVSYLNAAFSAN